MVDASSLSPDESKPPCGSWCHSCSCCCWRTYKNVTLERRERKTHQSDRYLPQLAIRPELKLEKLVAKLALVADIVAEVEIVGHTQSICKGSAG